MRFVAPRTIDRTTLDARRASWRVWIGAFVVWVIEALGLAGPCAQAAKRAVREELRAALPGLKALAFRHAQHRLRWGPPPGKLPRAMRAPPGFRVRAVPGSAFSRITRGVFRRMHAGDLHARCARLAALIENIEPYVARIVKRLERGFVMRRILPVAPAPLRLVADAPAPRSAGDDTS